MSNFPIRACIAFDSGTPTYEQQCRSCERFRLWHFRGADDAAALEPPLTAQDGRQAVCFSHVPLAAANTERTAA